MLPQHHPKHLLLWMLLSFFVVQTFAFSCSSWSSLPYMYGAYRMCARQWKEDHCDPPTRDFQDGEYMSDWAEEPWYDPVRYDYVTIRDGCKITLSSGSTISGPTSDREMPRRPWSGKCTCECPRAQDLYSYSSGSCAMGWRSSDTSCRSSGKLFYSSSSKNENINGLDRFVVRSGCTMRLWNETMFAGKFQEISGPADSASVTIGSIKSYTCYCPPPPCPSADSMTSCAMGWTGTSSTAEKSCFGIEKSFSKGSEADSADNDTQRLKSFVIAPDSTLRIWNDTYKSGTFEEVSGPVQNWRPSMDRIASYECSSPRSSCPLPSSLNLPTCAIGWSVYSKESNNSCYGWKQEFTNNSRSDVSQNNTRRLQSFVVRAGCTLKVWNAPGYMGLNAEASGPLQNWKLSIPAIYSYKCECSPGCPAAENLPPAYTNNSFCAAGWSRYAPIREHSCYGTEFRFSNNSLSASANYTIQSLRSFVVRPRCTLKLFSSTNFVGQSQTAIGPKNNMKLNLSTVSSYDCKCFPGCPLLDDLSNTTSDGKPLCAVGWTEYLAQPDESCYGEHAEFANNTASSNSSSDIARLKSFVIHRGCALTLYSGHKFSGQKVEILGEDINRNWKNPLSRIASHTCECSSGCPEPDELTSEVDSAENLCAIGWSRFSERPENSCYGFQKKFINGSSSSKTDQNTRSLRSFVIRRGCTLSVWTSEKHQGIPLEIMGPVRNLELPLQTLGSYVCECSPGCPEPSSLPEKTDDSSIEVCAVGWSRFDGNASDSCYGTEKKFEAGFSSFRSPEVQILRSLVVRPGCSLTMWNGTRYSGYSQQVTGPSRNSMVSLTEINSFDCDCSSPGCPSPDSLVEESKEREEEFCAKGWRLYSSNEKDSCDGFSYEFSSNSSATANNEIQRLNSFVVRSGCILRLWSGTNYTANRSEVVGPVTNWNPALQSINSYQCDCTPGCSKGFELPQFKAKDLYLCAEGWSGYSEKADESCFGFDLQIANGSKTPNTDASIRRLETYVIRPGCTLEVWSGQNYSGTFDEISGSACNWKKPFPIQSYNCSCDPGCPVANDLPVAYSQEQILCAMAWEGWTEQSLTSCKGRRFAFYDGQYINDASRHSPSSLEAYVVRPGCTLHMWEEKLYKGEYKEYHGPLENVNPTKPLGNGTALTPKSYRCSCAFRPITCVPMDKFDAVLQCDASSATVDTECSYVKSIG